MTLATDSTDLRGAAAQVFRMWAETLSTLLVEGGVPESLGRGTAILLISAAEGAVLVSRAQGEIKPFDPAVAGLQAHVDMLVS